MPTLKPDILPLPPPLMTSDAGSFARATIVERKPALIRGILNDNDYPPEIIIALDKLCDEIAHLPVGPLSEDAPDRDFWNAERAVFAGKTWLELPWFFAETYFYRRVLEAVRYLRPGEWQGHNPFQVQKDREMASALEHFAAGYEQFDWTRAVVPGTRADAGAHAMRPNQANEGARGARSYGANEGAYGIRPEESGVRPYAAIDGPDAVFDALLMAGLWGNRADLSNLGAGFKAHAGLGVNQDRHLLLVDDSQRLLAKLKGGLARVDFVNDNAGMELFFDLAMADFLLQVGWVGQITFHLKPRPFFVADAMPADLQVSVDWLTQSPYPAAKALGLRLADDLVQGRLKAAAEPFWATDLMLRRLPQSLLDELCQPDLVIFKGDVNYRRILDDRHWPFTTPMAQAAAYLPFAFASLRTLKGEMVVGLQPEQIAVLSAEDPAWLINGKRGVIHFIEKR